MSADQKLLGRTIEATRLDIARQEKLVLQLRREGQPDLAEVAQQHLDRTTADLQYLLDGRRDALLDLRRPKATSQLRQEGLVGIFGKRRSGS